MAFEQTWRWFGPNDPVSLKEIKQTGAEGIVTALHKAPVGEAWKEKDILNRKNIIESEGMKWSVVESIPVHEDIKKRKGNYKLYIENYKESIRNTGRSGIKTVCYNFMPVLDWLRTDLNVIYKDGSITSKFESKVFAAFDLFILKRKNAEKDYSNEMISQAEEYFKKMNEKEKDTLLATVLLGFPGSLEAYTLDGLRSALNEYDEISDNDLRENLYSFLQEIIPAAEEAGVYMAIHPDDPPWSVLGLPRIVSNKDDLLKITGAYKSDANGVTLCTGSLGAGYFNDPADISKSLAPKVSFVHLRNVTRNSNKDFMEENHLEGDVDIYSVVKFLLLEQKRRRDEGRKDINLPMRPDHGHLMIPDLSRKNIYPGYSLFGRMRGLAELRGLELGIIRSLNLR